MSTEHVGKWRHTRKPVGGVGSVLRFTDQSMNVAVPRMAKTMVSMWSIGTDLMHMARVPVFHWEFT